MPCSRPYELVVFHRINCLPVTDGGEPGGRVTTTDLLQAMHQLVRQLCP